MDKEEALSNPKNSRFTTEASRFSVCNIFRLKHGLLPCRVIPVQLQAMYDSTAVGKYEYLCLPMGLINSPDIFQEKMSMLMDGLTLTIVSA